MTRKDLIANALVMRDQVGKLAGACSDAGLQTQLFLKAAQVGSAIEALQQSAGPEESASYDDPAAKVEAARNAATAADPDGATACRELVARAEAARAALASLTGPARRVAGLRGALRVSQPVAPRSGGDVGVAEVTADPPASPPPSNPATSAGSYVTSLVLLFPTEAVTLFPIGRSIAGEHAGVLLLVIALVALFVGVLRYFGTQDEATGRPAWNEILVAQISFFLWVGSIGGYVVAPGHGLAPLPIDEKTLSSLFGFVIVMWVALVPYFIVKRQPPKA